MAPRGAAPSGRGAPPPPLPLWLLWLGAATRAALLGWGAWQDSHLAVKYTDIDYEVVTDGAAFMAAGRSPYARSTYRYTPLLAAALLPNVTVHRAWGKLLFSAADLLAAWMLSQLMRRRRGGASPAVQAAGLALWLFSPFTAAISTRGSGEALVTCMLLGMLWALQADRLLPAALLFGLAVHWRLYPIVFALPLLRHFALQRLQLAAAAARGPKQASTRSPEQASSSSGGSAGGAGDRTRGGAQGSGAARLAAARLAAAAARELVSPRGVAFGGISGGLFLLLAALLYRLYGWQYLHETYLYHASRVDPRHNFSPYFYPAYLASSEDTQGAASWDVGWAFSLAQVVLQAAVGWRCAGDLPFCLLLQTMVLVAFNKVCTAQYFVWYLSFLPLVLPDLVAAPNKLRLAAAAAAWGGAMAHWLLWAYLLEFRGCRAHLAVWAASLVFLAAHVWLICELVTAWRAGQQAQQAHQARPAKRKGS